MEGKMINKKFKFLAMTIFLVFSLIVFLVVISSLILEYNDDKVNKKQVKELRILLQGYKEINTELRKSSSHVLVGNLESRQFLSIAWEYLLKEVDSDIKKAEAILSQDQEINKRIKITTKYLKRVVLIQKKMVWIKQEVIRTSNRVWEGLNKLKEEAKI